MRDFSKVEPKGWHGATFRALRKKGPAALVVGLYLMTSPSSNMIGLYPQPLLYLAHETGLPFEGASKGLQDCIDVGLCDYDFEAEVVWVFEMAKYQISQELKATDLRCKGVQKEYDSLPAILFLGAFFDRYSAAFHMTRRRQSDPPFEAPSKPLRSQEQEQEQEKEQEQEQDTPLAGGPGGASIGAVVQLKPPPARKTAVPTCPYADIVDLYHEVLPELPRVRVLDTKGAGGRRKRVISERWQWLFLSKRLTEQKPRASTVDDAMAWLRKYFQQARLNDFIMGRVRKTPGHENWQADLEYLLGEKGLLQVIEKTHGEAQA